MDIRANERQRTLDEFGVCRRIAADPQGGSLADEKENRAREDVMGRRDPLKDVG
jgi:hypothetical protein